MNQLVALVGPSGVGKTRLSIELDSRFNGEIVNADSRQVYRYMDIGTAKPTPDEMRRVRHHLFDIVDPDEEFSLSQYQRLAYATINDIQQRQRLPFLVGGSGLYVWAVLEGWTIPEVPPDPGLRRQLEERAALSGAAELLEQLKQVDPVAAERIDPRNIRRVIRALEVYRYTGAPLSSLQKKSPPPYHVLIIGLTMDRRELYRRVDERVDRMIEYGLVEEVRRLVERGYGFDLPAMSGIGYRQVGMYLRGELTLEAAAAQIKVENHRLIRHQYAWFRLKDNRIKWFDILKQPEADIEELVRRMIS